MFAQVSAHVSLDSLVDNVKRQVGDESTNLWCENAKRVLSLARRLIVISIDTVFISMFSLFF